MHNPTMHQSRIPQLQCTTLWQKCKMLPKWCIRGCLCSSRLGWIIMPYLLYRSNHNYHFVCIVTTLTRKCRLNEIFVTGGTVSCQMTTYGAACDEHFVKMTTFPPAFVVLTSTTLGVQSWTYVTTLSMLHVNMASWRPKKLSWILSW